MTVCCGAWQRKTSCASLANMNPLPRTLYDYIKQAELYAVSSTQQRLACLAQQKDDLLDTCEAVLAILDSSGFDKLDAYNCAVKLRNIIAEMRAQA